MVRKLITFQRQNRAENDERTYHVVQNEPLVVLVIVLGEAAPVTQSHVTRELRAATRLLHHLETAQLEERRSSSHLKGYNKKRMV